MKCIFCQEEINAETLSKEHLPSESIGGFCVVYFVCRKCNNTLGHTIEADLDKNAFIVTALYKLGLKLDKHKLYRHADKYLQNPNGKILKAIVNKTGKPKVRYQKLNNGSEVMSDEQAINSLKKKVERLSKKTGRKMCFNTELFKKAKPGNLITIPGSGISFMKHSVTGGTQIIEGLKGPIPFRYIGKIAFEHLAWLDLNLVHKQEFDPIRQWILKGTEDQFVFFHSLLRGKKPEDLKYKPFHYVLLRFKDNYLVAIVCLFSALIFSVFLAEISKITNNTLLKAIQYYHMYDLDRKKPVLALTSTKQREWHNVCMDYAVFAHKQKDKI